MKATFELCPSALERYQELRLEPSAKRSVRRERSASSCVIPDAGAPLSSFSSCGTRSRRRVAPLEAANGFGYRPRRHCLSGLGSRAVRRRLSCVMPFAAPKTSSATSSRCSRNGRTRCRSPRASSLLRRNCETPPNYRMQATAGGLKGAVPTHPAFAHAPESGR